MSEVHVAGAAPAAACTIIARNYVAQARVLIDSFFAHTPGARFYLFVVDGLPPGVQLHPDVRVLGPEDVTVPGFREMRFKYDVTELCTAVKPSLLRFLLFETKEAAIVYFDPDIVIFRNLYEMWDCLERSEIVLIPHLLDPIPMDGLRPDEQVILAAGAYNLGFIALRATPDTDRLLVWWQERLQDKCRIDIPHALFVDQKWIDLVPGFFSGTAILRDDTYDVAYWNLHSRHLSFGEEDQVFVNGKPLGFFHFSGYDPTQTRSLSKHQNRHSVVEGAPLAHLLDLYSELVHQRGFLLARGWRYGYGEFDSGVPIANLHRHLYHGLNGTERERFGDPFQARSVNSFFLWSVRPAPEFHGLSPFLNCLLQERLDIRAAFGDPWGMHREQFIAWAMTDGAQQMNYAPMLADVAFWRDVDALTPSAMDRTAVITSGDLQHPPEPIEPNGVSAAAGEATRVSSPEIPPPIAQETLATQVSNQPVPVHVPPMDLGHSSHGPLGVLAKRSVDFLLRYHTHYQGEVNLSLAATLRELQDREAEHQRQLDDMRNELRDLAHSAELSGQVARQESDLGTRMEHVATVVDRLAASFAARPYMPQDAFGAQRDLDKPMGFGLDVQAGASSASVPDFEELLRGSEEFVAERQRAYLPLFDGLQEVVDLGSGRGEFLTLLRERGIRAVGVELNEKLVARCYARGLAVERADALDYLESRAEQSLDAIFSAQFIEHVPSNRLSELLQLGHSKLRHGGIFVAETVNTQGNQALRTSHVDPTHQRPIDPQVLLYLCQQAGFLSGRILYPVNGGLTQHAYAQAGYYALVGLR